MLRNEALKLGGMVLGGAVAGAISYVCVINKIDIKKKLTSTPVIFTVSLIAYATFPYLGIAFQIAKTLLYCRSNNVSIKMNNMSMDNNRAFLAVQTFTTLITLTNPLANATSKLVQIGLLFTGHVLHEAERHYRPYVLSRSR